ncbi:MAG: hypothetical protein ABSH56_03160 [Bryobacteraceae bacterium]
MIQHAVTALPLVVAGGLVLLSPAAAVATLAHPATAGAAAALIANLGPNLAAAGLSALCKPRRFLAGKEHQEHLANHDILRLVRKAWAEAAAATVAAYAEAHAGGSVTSLSLEYPAPPQAFLKILREVKPDDFVPEQVTVGTIRSAIEASRRSLLGGPAAPEEAELKQHVEFLESALVASVVDTIAGKLDASSVLPPGFKDFVSGQDPRSQGGILSQLCIYVALHLKTDDRAQTAVLHFTLQDVSDRLVDMQKVQRQISEFCKEIYRSRNESQKAVLEAFENQVQILAKTIEGQIALAFNEFVRPRLDPPFATTGARLASPFTYRARWTPLVGREPAMDALVRFLGDPRRGAWTVISGPAGTGKSRLAAELIAMACDPAAGSAEVPIGRWRAGFLQRDNWLKDEARKWCPDADTLIVIDYAGDLDHEELSNFLAALNGKGGPAGCAIRVVLIDRLPPDSDLGLVSRLTHGKDRGGEILDARWVSAGGTASRPDTDARTRGETYSSRFGARSGNEPREDPLALLPVAEPSALDIAAAWAGRKWTSAVAERLQEAMREDAELARPLFAALLGHAVGTDGLPPGELNPVTVADTALAHQFRALETGAGGHWEQAKKLLALATAGQGVSEEALFEDMETVRGLTGEPALSETALEELQRNLRLFGGTAPGELIPPLQPDFLGGLFVLRSVLRLPTALAPAKADLLMSLAWKLGRNPSEFLARLASDFVGRAGQLASAATREGAHPDARRVNGLLVRLILSAATPEALRRGGSGVLAAAIQRV